MRSLGIVATVTATRLLQLSPQLAQRRVVTIFEKCLLAPIAALGDVMGDARKDKAGEASHANGLSKGGSCVNN